MWSGDCHPLSRFAKHVTDNGVNNGPRVDGRQPSSEWMNGITTMVTMSRGIEVEVERELRGSTVINN